MNPNIFLQEFQNKQTKDVFVVTGFMSASGIENGKSFRKITKIGLCMKDNSNACFCLTWEELCELFQPNPTN